MSMKFPRLYKSAAQILQRASEEDTNVKHILYNDKRYMHYNIKSLYGIVAKVLKNWDIIETLINESSILSENSKLDVWWVRVIIAELLFNKRDLQNHENHTLKTIIQYEEQFKKIFSKHNFKELVKNDDRNQNDVAEVRFIKVNLIKDDVASVVERFQEDGWEKLETASTYEDYLLQLNDLDPNSSVFLQDFNLQEVLAFPPETELQNHDLYINGSIFFMDKASCLAPLLLAPKRNSDVLDLCAAPGLKTIQLAAYVAPGKVYAVEKDDRRFEILQNFVEHSGANNVVALLQDATKINVKEFKNVEYILVDPSCSGSGIRKRLPCGTLKSRQDEKIRLEKLTGFQITLLRFALTRFPAAKRVVYSTCSLNVEENERVVEDALNSYYHNFEIVSVHNKLPGWKSFGSKDFHFGNKCIYCRPGIDQTNGFFVAVFERKKTNSDEFYENEQINNTKVEYNSKKNKRIYEDNCGENNLDLKISSHKRLKVNDSFRKELKENNKENYMDGDDIHKKLSSYKKLECKLDPSDREMNGIVKTKGEIVKGKENIKRSSLSEKKRSRKKILKIKKKLLKKEIKPKSIKAKVNVQDKNKIKNSEKNKFLNQTSDKISKSKLRYERLKKLKSSLSAVASSIDKNNSKTKLTIFHPQSKEEKSKKKIKSCEKISNEDGNVSSGENKVEEANCRKESAALTKRNKLKTKNIKDKIKSLKSDISPQNIDSTDEITRKVKDEIEEKKKVKKHKKNPSSEFQNTITDINVEDIKTAEGITKTNEKLKSKKQKKNTNATTQQENNIAGIVNGSSSNIPEHVEDETEQKKKVKKRKKNLSLECENTNTDINVEVNKTTEGVTKTNEKLKSKKQKSNSTNATTQQENNIAGIVNASSSNVPDHVEDETEVKKKVKKHKKNLSLECENTCTDINVEDNKTTEGIIKTNEKLKSKKQKKNTNATTRQENNIAGIVNGSSSNVPEHVEDETEQKKKVKKRKKNLSLECENTNTDINVEDNKTTEGITNTNEKLKSKKQKNKNTNETTQQENNTAGM